MCAGVAELVDAPDLGSGDESRGGSSPFTRTNPLAHVRIWAKFIYVAGTTQVRATDIHSGWDIHAGHRNQIRRAKPRVSG